MPRFIFPSGDGNNSKGFKCEWMCVKENVLYIGSTGKEWTRKGDPVNLDLLWVKVVDVEGHIKIINWRDNYLKLTDKLEIHNSNDGYIVHEAVNWNPVNKKWYFLPRYVSHAKYDEDTESTQGSNTLFIASEDFKTIESKTLGEKIETHGFSSFKFVPFRSNEVIALKSVETKGKIETFLTILDVEANEYLLMESLVDANKYEGVEFISFF